MAQPFRARLEALVGVALGALVITIGAYLPGVFHLLLVPGIGWAAASAGVLAATAGWGHMPVSRRRRVVMASHLCGLFPVVLMAAGPPGGTVFDPDDLGPSE
jgi:hypothetical protein